MSAQALALNLTTDYGYVLGVAAASFFVNTYHMVLVAQARKKSGVAYPNAYASKEVADKDPNAYAFNCAQRAHSNYLENHPSFVGALLISGLKFPLVSAGLGATWLVSRVIYAKGYIGNGPKGRRTGSAGHYLTDFPLKCMALYTAVTMALAL